MNALVMVGVLVVFALLGMLWANFDKKNEKRRKAFHTLAIKLREYGLTRLPEILEAYAIGDWSEFFRLLYKFADMLDDGEDVVLKDFDRVYETVQAKKLATPEGRALLKQKLSEYETPVVPTVVVTTPVVA